MFSPLSSIFYETPSGILVTNGLTNLRVIALIILYLNLVLRSECENILARLQVTLHWWGSQM